MNSSAFRDWNRERAVHTYRSIEQIVDNIEKKVEEKIERKRKELEEKYDQDLTNKELKGKLKELEKEKQKLIEDHKAQLLSICRKIPMQLKENGIITVLAYYIKGKDENEKKNIGTQVGRAIENWLFTNFIKEKEGEKKHSSVKYLAGRSFTTYNFLTKEAIEYTLWLKRNAEGMIS